MLFFSTTDEHFGLVSTCVFIKELCDILFSQMNIVQLIHFTSKEMCMYAYSVVILVFLLSVDNKSLNAGPERSTPGIDNHVYGR